MKFIFQTMPAYGHLNPMLGVAKKLVEDGHEVVIHNLAIFKKQIEKVGARFRTSTTNFKMIDFRILHNATNIAEQSLIAAKQLTQPLVELIRDERPDCLIHDSLSIWGKLAGIITHIPTVAFVPSMAINTDIILSYTKFLLPDYIYQLKHFSKTIDIFNQHRKLYQDIDYPPPFFTDMFGNKEKLNIVFTSDYFQPNRKSFDSSYKFVGPIIYNREEKTIPSHLLNTKKPIIYVALGTVYNDNLALYKSLTQMFKNTPYQAFISIGKYIDRNDLGKIPDNVYVDKYLPQLELLKKASLFISHGGMNSVNESLYFGVPMLLIPHIQEQRINADRVEELGAGICYPKTSDDIQEYLKYVEKIMKNPSYKFNAEKISKALIQAGGENKAVENIYAYLR
ncbi:hypothetical protein HZC27_03805 [Candidatus Roizmanbacteria bacterium]|nr:hypothetical protein [Candidatus Roizmanbacteria bacterium]